jgi:large subunit ribosomal protein L22
MKAHLRSARIAPKKANLIAKMIRGMPVSGALDALRRTHKKGARMVEQLIKSAVANAEHNDRQDPSALVVKTIIVNQGTGYRRGVPMSRGRIRPMTKFLSHISLTLGVADASLPESAPTAASAPTKKTARTPAKKKPTASSQEAKNTVKLSPSNAKASKGTPVQSADSSDSSESSASSSSDAPAKGNVSSAS